MSLPAGLIRALESAANAWMGLDPDNRAHMAALEGRCIGIEFTGLNLQLYLYPDGHGIRISDSHDGPADTVLHGSPLALARLGIGGKTGKPLFTGEVTISGDVETGQTFKAILDDMDIDWEEHLSRLTGDAVAHQLGNAARRAGRVLHHGRRTLERDIGEYLKEELQLLPARTEIENFGADVARLRTDTDRLAARIQRLQHTDDGA
ncbi:MAG: SCP2 sterol-binding domain-containing protein [Gammaproteobacteria bacterium]|jgi:ubiquinone biosynthesis protein UbiJ